MAKGFQLTAELNLRGPSNIRQVVGGIRKQLQGINTNLNININKKNIQGMQQANTRLAAINKTLQTTVKSANNATAAFNKLSASMRSVGNVKISPNIASGMNNTTKSVVTTTKAVQQAKNEFEEFGKLGGLAIKRFAAFSVVTGAIYAVNNAISAGVKSFLEYDRQLTRVSQVLDTSRASLKGLDQSITALSTSLGVSSTELANVTVTLSQAGIQAADTRKALEALAKSALAPTFASLTNTTEGAIAAMRQFSISAGQLEGALGSINAVAGKFAVEASDIITAIQRTGGVFASASKGVSQGTAALNEFIAVFTSVRATSRESAETIATGLRTIFTRLQRQDTIDALKQFGVTLTDLEGKFVGPYKAIQLLSEGLRSLDTRDLKFAGIAEELGGFRQIGKVLPLIQQFGTAQQALNVAQQGSSSLAKDAAKGQLALAVQIQKVREEFTALVRSISDSTGFRTLLTVGLDLSRVFIGVADALKGVLPLLAGLGAMKGLSALAGFTKGFGGVFKKAEGGYIHKFARGGTVPGTGSGDTVPAMLQPGEFVIRKKAVETLGTKRLHKMNKFGNGGKNKKTKKDFQNIEATGGVHFTHLDGGRTGLPKELGIRKVYTNMGLDLPASWNLNWAKPKKDGKGATGKRLANYIKGNSVFSTLLKSGTGTKPYGFEGRSKSEAYDLLNTNRVKLRQNLAKKINKNSQFDTDADVTSKLPSYLSSAIKQTIGKDAKKLQEGFEEESAYTKEGKAGRRRLSKRRKNQLPPRAEFASGGSVQDTVPAMLTPGEFVINKSSASKLGTSTLNKLNNADRIKGYNRGGFVGFANGGQAPARPGSTFDSIGISRNDITLISAVGDEIQQLGITSSSAAALIESGQQVTYQSALEALETDKFRAKSIGASTKSIDANIKALKKQAEGAQKVSNALKGASGEQLQNLSNRLDRGQNLGKAARKSGLGGVTALARSGDIETKDIQAYIAQASRDRKTLNQMDKFQINERKNQLLKQNKSLKDATRIAKEEVAARRKIVDQVARSQGAKGPGDFGRGLGKISNQLGIGVSLLSSAASSLSEATTAGGAASNAAIQGGGLAFGAGQIATGAAVDLLPDKFKALGAGVGLAASAALAVGQAFIDASNAARQFKIDESFKKADKAMEDVNKAFEKLEKDLNNVNVRNSLETKLLEAGNAIARGVDIQNNQAKIFWTNAIDTVLSGGSQESVQRAQILETQGFFAYMRSVADSSFREVAVAAASEMRVTDTTRQFKPVADGLLKLFETQLRGGASVEDIIGGANFGQFANSIGMADRATAELVDQIRNNTNISQAEKDARIQNITTIAAEEAVRRQGSIVAQQKQIQALERSTSIYTRSLERMYRNMEQSINRASASLNKMNDQIGLTIASMQGEARVGGSSLDSLTTLENPRAFSAAENRAAIQRGSEAFGNNSANIQDLVGLGETIENTVMGAVNSVLSNNPGATNATVEGEIAQSVDKALSDVGLPPALADKMAAEVNRALKDLSSEGQDSVDYSKLAEKLGNLNSVIETSKRAREVVVKLLQHQQKAITSYTSNLNKIIDIEIRSRQSARKAVDILADGELTLAKALGKTVSVLDVINSRDANVGRQTGGLKTVNDIFNRINELAAKRASEQGVADVAADQGDMDSFTKFSNSVKDTSVQLRENIAALKDLAQNGDVAAAALNKIQEAQQSNAQKVGFFEKVVTSTPDQLEGMNRAFVRLQRNLNGQVNTIDQSVGAQKAYFEALKGGASQFEAMRAAQGAFAQERGESLSLLKDIMPFLGDSEQSGGIRATALESMLRESGVGVNPMMQQVLNNLRNPQVDPAVQAAIKQYNEANALQSAANKSLANLDSQLANNVAVQNEQAFTRALKAVPMTFENQELRDIDANVSTIKNILSEQRGGGGPAPGFARGGVIYAAGGQQIFQPKGTDTVPAMLTPGEFVVNRSATQANLPLLKNINSGYYAAGGLVTGWNRDEPFTPESDTQQQSKKSYLPLEFAEKYKSYGNNPFFYLPRTYFSTTSSTAQSPLTNATNQEAQESTFKNLDFSNSRNEVGFVPDIKRFDSGSPFGRLSYSNFGQYQSLMLNSMEPIGADPGMKGPIFDPDHFTNMQPVKMLRSQLDDYRKAFAGAFEHVDGAVFDTFSDIDKVGTNSKSSSYTVSNFNMANRFGISKGVPQFLSPSQDLFKIWTDQTSAFGFNLPWDAASVHQPNFAGEFGTLGGFLGTGMGGGTRNFEEKPIPGKMLNRGAGNTYLKGQDKFDNLAKAHKFMATNLNTLLADLPGLTEDDFVLQGLQSGTGIYDKLFNLMAGNSAFEYFNTDQVARLKGAQDFAPPGRNIGSLVVANAANLQQDILNRAKEVQDILANQPNANVKDMGIFGADSITSNTMGTVDTGFDIGGEGGGARLSLPWAANKTAAELGVAFKQADEAAKEAAKGTDGTNTVTSLGLEEIKLPYNGFGIDLITQYKNYVGKLYDAKLFDFTDTKLNRFLPVQGAGADPRHLFTNIPGPGELLQIGLKDKLKPADIKKGLSVTAEDIENYRNSLATGGDQAVGDQAIAHKGNEAVISNAILSLSPLLQQKMPMTAIPKFLGEIDQPRDFAVGAQLIEGIKNSTDLQGTAGKQIAEDPKFGQGNLSESVLPKVLKSLTKSGLQLFGKYNFVKGVSQFLGRSIGGIPRNGNITSENAANFAGIAANAFGQVGGAANAAFGKAGNNGMAQYIKSAYILASGAWQAFSGLRDGNTGLINDFVQASNADGEIPVGYAEGLFRSLGAGAALDAVKNYKLPQDLVGKLDESKGGQIAQIGSDGSISYKPMTDALPTDVASLMDFIFNPYNEFPTRSARTNIMGSFQKNLNNLKDPSGRRPFFDNQTSAFMNEGINRLKTWYGGDEGSQRLANDAFRGVGNLGGFWPGHDLLHTDGKTPENAKALFDMFGNSNYAAASEANAAFGITNKFGPLPDASWFLARGRAAAVEPTQKARGGMIYASEGQMINFQPRGTDTVPAMLTPGEFVVNRQATQQNLPLLKSINRSQGGPVYFDKGGLFPEITGSFSAYSDFKPKARVQEEKKKIEEDPPYPGAFEDKKRQYYIARGDSEQSIAKYDAYKKQQAIDNGWLATANKAVQQGLGKVKNFAAMAQKTATGFAGNVLAGMGTAMATSAMTRGATAQGTEETDITAEQTGSAKSDAEKNAGAVGVKPQTSSTPKRVRESDKVDAERRAEQQERDRKFAEKEKRLMAEKADREAKEAMYKKRLALVGRLNSRFDMMIAREDAEIKQQSQARDDAGFWYNSIKPMLGGGDTQFAPAIQAAKNKRGTAVYAKSLVEKFVQSQDVSFLKQAAGIAGLDIEDGVLQSRIRETRDTDGNLQISGLAASQRTDAADQARMLEDTEKGITAAAQNTADAVMIAGAGVGGLASSGAKVTQAVGTQVAKAVGGSVLEGVGTQGVLEAEKVSSGRQTVGEGLRNTAIQGVTSAVMPFLGRAAGRLLGKAGGEAAEVGKRVAGDMADSAKKADAVLNQKMGSYNKYLDGIRDKATRAGLGDEVDFQIEAAMANGTLNQGFVDEVNSRLAKKANFDRQTTKFGRELQYDSFDSNVQKRVMKGWKEAKTSGTANDQTRDQLLEFGQMQMDRRAMIARDASSAATKASSAADVGTAEFIPDPDLKSLLDFSNIPEGRRMVPAQSSWYNPRELFNRFKGVVRSTGDAAGTSSDKEATGLFTQIFGGSRTRRTFNVGLLGAGAYGAHQAMNTEDKKGRLASYFDTGGMAPRGTDVVPAMLTPGEFVVNRQASQANLPLLKSINSGVSYFKNGGEADEEKMGQYDKGQAAKKGAYDKAQEEKRQHEEHKKQANARAKDIAREQQIPLQQAYQQALQEIEPSASANAASSGGAASGGAASNTQAQIPQISQQQQAMTAQASQAAFDPRNSGDVNKQLAIFGQVLTGVNQVLVQYGTVIQSLVAAQGQLTQGGGGGQGEGENGGVSNGNGIAEYTQKFGEFVNSLKDINIPEQITLTGTHEVNVNVAGGKELTQAMQGPMGDYIIGRVNDGLASWVSQNFDDVSDPNIT